MQEITDRKVLLRVDRAQNRILTLYFRLSKKGLGWRAVRDKLGLPNVRYAWEFVTRGVIPANPDIRRKLGLPKNLYPKPRKPQSKLALYQKWWRDLTQSKRNNFIRGLWRQK